MIPNWFNYARISFFERISNVLTPMLKVRNWSTSQWFNRVIFASILTQYEFTFYYMLLYYSKSNPNISVQI